MRPMPQLEVVEIPTEQLLEYPNNAKLHPHEQVDQIANSISEFGFNSPILAWHNNDGEPEIVAGHGRLMAAKKLGMEKLPVVFLDHLSEEARRAYILVDNKLTMNSDYDMEILADELAALESFDMAEFGFLYDVVGEEQKNPYTMKVEPPQYEVKGDDVPIDELYDNSKVERLLSEIRDADGITSGEKRFLEQAAQRHAEFSYSKIAEYYAKATPAMQRLMEASALVIIDVDDAIAKGYAKLSKNIEEMRGE